MHPREKHHYFTASQYLGVGAEEGIHIKRTEHKVYIQVRTRTVALAL
jgi:hypothetical protein